MRQRPTERILTALIDFRRSLGRFATGVTVVTCQAADGSRLGITANSFSSVSLEPPLILWNIAKVSRSLDAFLAAEYFGVSVLAADQQALSVRFARSDIDPFAGLECEASTNAVPRLDGALAWFECRRYQTHDCGDHHIVVGEVIDFDARDGEPLIFYRSQYRELADS